MAVFDVKQAIKNSGDAKTMKVLFLTKYDRMGASSRYRSLQYFPALERAGIACSSAPLFSDDYLKRVYATGKGALGNIVSAFASRLLNMPRWGGYDLVVIEYELFPYLPPLFEHLLSLFGVRYLVDYDDAVFHRYDRHNNAAIRCLLGGKIDTVMRHAAGVIVGNAYLEAYARQAGAQRIHRLPTVVDLEKYGCRHRESDDGELCIAWIGSPSTTVYLRDLLESLAATAPLQGVKIAAMGAVPFTVAGVRIEFHPWSEEREVTFLASCDIGIMPLPETPWTLGKCGFKLIQYMACGLPVVASPVGMNCEIVEPGVNGFLASSADEWRSALQALKHDRGMRLRMGNAGRDKVEERYSLQATAERYVAIIREAAQG